MRWILYCTLIFLFVCPHLVAVPLSGLIASWHADGNAYDSVGSNQGTLLDNTGFQAGVRGSAFALDGVNDGVVVPNTNGIFNLVNQWTLSTWVKPFTDGFDARNAPILWKVATDGGNEDTFTLGWTTENRFAAGLERASDGYDFAISSEMHAKNQFYHVLATYDNADLKIYVNGILEGSITIGAAVAYTGPSALRIGNILNTNHGYAGVFQGLIDETLIYNRALNATEVTAIYSEIAVPELSSLLALALGMLAAWAVRNSRIRNS